MTRSKKQERKVAEDIGGLPVPASGAFWHRKGDVRSHEFLIEAKTTENGSFSIKKEIWEKIRREALLDGKSPVLAIQIQDRNLAVLDWEDFLGLLELVTDFAERDLGEGELP